MTVGAPQKRSHTIKPGGQQVKHECGCGRFSYLPQAQARIAAEHGGDICSRCGGRFLPAHIEDCANLAPNLLHLHGDYTELAAAVDRIEWGASDAHCQGCEWRRPEGAHPDYWYCRKCSHINERRPDGSLGIFHADPFSPEVEKANGLARKITRERKVKALPQPDRYRPVADDIPF